MNYTKEEKLAIGKEIFETGITSQAAANKYGIGKETARTFRVLYEASIGLCPMPDKSHRAKSPKYLLKDDFESMSKDELIKELMKSKINEERLKKGYMVKGDGANKEFFLSGNKNIK